MSKKRTRKQDDGVLAALAAARRFEILREFRLAERAAPPASAPRPPMSASPVTWIAARISRAAWKVRRLLTV